MMRCAGGVVDACVGPRSMPDWRADPPAPAPPPYHAHAAAAITWKRVLDTNDRFLRSITIGQGPQVRRQHRRGRRAAMLPLALPLPPAARRALLPLRLLLPHNDATTTTTTTQTPHM